jgi:hypothetical protein
MPAASELLVLIVEVSPASPRHVLDFELINSHHFLVDARLPAIPIDNLATSGKPNTVVSEDVLQSRVELADPEGLADKVRVQVQNEYAASGVITLAEPVECVADKLTPTGYGDPAESVAEYLVEAD